MSPQLQPASKLALYLWTALLTIQLFALQSRADDEDDHHHHHHHHHKKIVIHVPENVHYHHHQHVSKVIVPVKHHEHHHHDHHPHEIEVSQDHHGSASSESSTHNHEIWLGGKGLGMGNWGSLKLGGHSGYNLGNILGGYGYGSGGHRGYSFGGHKFSGYTGGSSGASTSSSTPLHSYSTIDPGLILSGAKGLGHGGSDGVGTGTTHSYSRPSPYGSGLIVGGSNSHGSSDAVGVGTSNSHSHTYPHHHGSSLNSIHLDTTSLGSFASHSLGATPTLVGTGDTLGSFKVPSSAPKHSGVSILSLAGLSPRPKALGWLQAAGSGWDGLGSSSSGLQTASSSPYTSYAVRESKGAKGLKGSAPKKAQRLREGWKAVVPAPPSVMATAEPVMAAAAAAAAAKAQPFRPSPMARVFLLELDSPRSR